MDIITTLLLFGLMIVIVQYLKDDDYLSNESNY